MIERLSLNSLKFFYFVAQYNSVTIAANKLCVTQSAVSKQIYNLEDTLGIILFDRKKKKLQLTPQGKLLFNCCQKIFTELDLCLIELKQNTFKNKKLILSCESTLSMKWLIPRLSKFKQRGYDFDITLLTGGGIVDFENQKIDIAIRRNDFHWGEHIFSEKIADEYISLIKSTKISEQNNVLISTSRPNLLKDLNKIKIFKDRLKQYSKVELEHFYLCLEGCLTGLGTTIISLYMIEKEIEYDLLEKIIPPLKDGSAYYLLSRQSFEEDPRKLILLEWLRQEMVESQAKI